MKTLSATPDRTLQPGQKVRVTDDEGRELVAGGWAVELDGDGEPVARRPVKSRAPRGKRPPAKGKQPVDEDVVDGPLTDEELEAARERGLVVDDPDNPVDPAVVRALLAQEPGES